MDSLVAQEDREDGEIIEIDLEEILSSEGENNGEIIDLEEILSSEGESLRKRIHQLEARNLELEKIASISVNSYDYAFSLCESVGYADCQDYHQKYKNSSQPVAVDRKRSRRYESSSKIPSSVKRRRRRSTSSPRRQLGRKRTVVSPIKVNHEKIRRRKRKKEVEIKSKHNYCSSSSDDNKRSPYDTNLLKAAIRRTDIKKSPQKLDTNLDEFNNIYKNLESSEDIESNILELRLQALQSTELLKNEPVTNKPEIDDKEEQELRCIALKSAVVKKHEARLRKKLELRPYSPTDVINEKIEVPYVSPILSPVLNHENEKMDISPDISSADCVPVDMVFSSDRSNSPTYFNDNVKTNNFTEILIDDDKRSNDTQSPKEELKIDLKPDSNTDFSLEEDCLRSLLLSNLKKKKTKDVKELPDSPKLIRNDLDKFETTPPPTEYSLEKNNEHKLANVGKVSELDKSKENTCVSVLKKLVDKIILKEPQTIINSVVKLPIRKSVSISNEITEIPVEILKKKTFAKKPQFLNDIVKPVPLKPKKVEISPIFSPADSSKATTPKKIVIKPKTIKPILKKTINVLTPAKINQSIKALTIDIPSMKKIQNTANKSPLSINHQSKKVSPMIIRLGISSESEDDFYAQHNIENNKPALIKAKCDVPEKSLNESIVPVTAPPEFEIKLDQFLKNARSKLEKKTVTLPKENTTPMAVRHLPQSSQLEYKRLINRMKLLEKQKISKSKLKILKNIQVTVQNENVNNTVIVVDNSNNETDKQLENNVQNNITITVNDSCRSISVDQPMQKTVELPTAVVINKNTNLKVAENVEKPEPKIHNNALTVLKTLPEMNVEAQAVVLKRAESNCLQHSSRFVSDLDMFLELISKAKIESEKEVEYTNYVNSLKEKLENAEKLLSKQQHIVSEVIHPKILNSRKNIEKTRLQCNRLNKFCLNVGAIVTGRDYKLPGYNRDKIDEKSKVIAVEIKKLKTISSVNSKKSDLSESSETTIAEESNKSVELMTQSPKIILQQNKHKSPKQILLVEKERKNNFQKDSGKREELLSDSQILKYNSPLDHMKNDSTGNPNDVMCPYDLSGECQDKSCTYAHFSKRVS